MNTTKITKLAGLMALGLTIAVLAQPATRAEAANCTPGQAKCQQAAAPSSKTVQNQSAPKIGDSAKSGKAFVRAANSRVSAPPSGQEYRVVKNNLVLMTTKTGKIAKVLGPISNYTK